MFVNTVREVCCKWVCSLCWFYICLHFIQRCCDGCLLYLLPVFFTAACRSSWWRLLETPGPGDFSYKTTPCSLSDRLHGSVLFIHAKSRTLMQTRTLTTDKHTSSFPLFSLCLSLLDLFEIHVIFAFHPRPPFVLSWPESRVVTDASNIHKKTIYEHYTLCWLFDWAVCWTALVVYL